MSRIGKLLLEAAKYPESWTWETSSHVRHNPTRITLYAPGPIRLRIYDEKVYLGYIESIRIRFRLRGVARKQRKQKIAAREAVIFAAMTNKMLGIKKDD